ncbi:hypothetical protein ASF45_31935 [Pseudorhodoferax sp. Leaf265]|nr:hypothetical protein ASF45_31935 [Pseudorhodoferax sp. Leaf265]
MLKELGPGVGEVDGDISSSTYSYVQFTDGTMLRNVVVVGGLAGKLDVALESKQTVELHVQPGLKKNGVLLAVKLGDNLYASDISGSLFFMYVAMAVLILLGVATIWVFGLGLLFLAFAFYTWLSLSLVRATKKYVRGLHGAILL